MGWAICRGDINQDGNIDITDYSIWQQAANSFLYGYLPEDLNGDINVDISDFVIWQLNANAFIFAMMPLFTDVAENTNDNEVKIFPNPASHYFYFNTQNATATLQLFSASGSKLEQFDVGSQIINKIEISEYPSGVYYLKYENAGKSFTKKLMIQN